jgi:hypothetical protein
MDVLIDFSLFQVCAKPCVHRKKIPEAELGWIRKLLKGDLSRKRFREVAEDNPLVVENLAKKYPTLTREIAMRKYLDVLKKKCS